MIALKTCNECGSTRDLALIVADEPNDVGQYEQRYLCRRCDKRPYGDWCANARRYGCIERGYCPRDPNCGE